MVKISSRSALYLSNIFNRKHELVSNLELTSPICKPDDAFLFLILWRNTILLPPLHFSDFHGLKSVKKLHFFQVVQMFYTLSEFPIHLWYLTFVLRSLNVK